MRKRLLFLLFFLLPMVVCFSHKLPAAGTIGGAKLLPDGAPVTLTGKIATTTYNELPGWIYVEEQDRSSGILVDIRGYSYPSVYDGKVVTVTGNIYSNWNDTSPNYERFIKNAVISVTGTLSSPLHPLMLKNRLVGGTAFGGQRGVRNGLGLNNIGLLVKTCGWVKEIGPLNNYAVLDDGSGAPVQVDISRLIYKPKVDYFITVTGLVSTKTDGSDVIPIIRPRRQNEAATDVKLYEFNRLQAGVNQVCIQWLGQGGFFFKDNQGRRIAVDPYLSDYCKSTGSQWVRLVPVPVDPVWLQPGLTLTSHDHGDHTDPWTLKAVRIHSGSTFCGPTSCCTHFAATDIAVPFNRRIKLDRGQTTTWNGIPITAVYANHTTDSVGFIFTMGGKKIYISGDTLYDQTLVNTVKAQNPDIMLVCINGLLGNMTASEAASLVKACNPKYVIPMHFGMFAVNTVDPQVFVDACRTQGVTSEIIVLPHFGYTML